MATADPRPLLVVAADPRELAGLLRRCRAVKRMRWPVRFARTAVLQGRDLLLVANGWGAALAGEACEVAWNKTRAAALLSAGFCGALDPSLEAGSIVVAGCVAGEAGEPLSASPLECARPHRTGTLVSVDRVVADASEKASLSGNGFCAVEMEALSVALRARQWGVPFYAVKAVTDLSGETLALDFNAARSERGGLSVSRLLAQAARRPRTLVPELARMYLRSRLAADALGEFLADCRF